MATGYFSYSKEGESIIISDTLFDQSSVQTTDAKKLFFEVKKLSEKDSEKATYDNIVRLLERQNDTKRTEN